MNRSHIKESLESRSKVSEKIDEGQSPFGEARIRSGELDQDDLYSTIEPNDILDLPRVGLKDNQIKLGLICCVD